MTQMKILLVNFLPRFEVADTPQLDKAGLRVVDKAFFIQAKNLYVRLRPREEGVICRKNSGNIIE